MAKGKSFISKELKETLLINPRIGKVHFTAKGDHYFEVYEHGKRLYGFIATHNIIVKGAKVEQKIPMLNTLIIESIDREDVLGTSKGVEA